MAPPQLGSPSSEALAASPPSVNKGTAPSRRAKAPHEYSTNPNTVRARRRLSNLPPYQLAVERARQNDTKAVQAPWKKLAESKSFQAASQTDKEKIMEEVKKEVMDRRRGKKQDAESKIAALNQQYSIEENNASAPLSIGPNQAVADSVSRLFALPHTAFNRDIATSLVTTSQETPAQHIAPPALASTSLASTSSFTSTSASLSTHNAGTAPKTLTSLTNSPSNRAQAINAAIESLREQHETEKRRYEAKERHHEHELGRLGAEMQEMRILIQSLTQRVDQLSMADHHTASHPPAPAPSQQQAQQAQMQQTFHIYPQHQQQADFVVATPSTFSHTNASEIFPAPVPVDQHNYHHPYPYAYPFRPDWNNGYGCGGGHQYPAIDNNSNNDDNGNNTDGNAVPFSEAIFEIGVQERGV
ncbi:hypothetical protein F5B22DRAFT_546376 [Xylaria bambusicola]|uniref:uncharacterized protein n=1 Tax=Xylaria bambusicola TaxID=326684 RepID=UPI0020089216|nr:uncharacterized protein F5B22DRAFT_546376 [Xylaria bambusicola]KAI0521672.1 hypothetical protein F5B22DRAFT_546376 [Xylaria bambusicola]